MRLSVAIVIALFFSPFVLALPMNDPPSPPPPSGDKGKGKEKAENRTPTPESTGGHSEHSSSSGGLDLGHGHPDVGKVKMFPLGSYEQARPDGTPFNRNERRVKHPAVVVGTKKSTEGSEDPTLRIAPMSHDENIVGKVPSRKYVTGPDEGSRIHTHTPKDAPSSAGSMHKTGGEPWNVHGFKDLRHDVKQNHKMGPPQRSNTIAVQPHGGGHTDEAQHGHGGHVGHPGNEPHPGQITRHNTIGVPPTTEHTPGANRGTGSRGRPPTPGNRGGRGRGRSTSPTRGGSRGGSPARGGSRGGSPARGNSQNRAGSNNRGRGRGRGRGGNNPNAGA